MRQAPLDVLLIFGRAIAGERSRIIGKLDYDVARARHAFRRLELPTPHHETAAEFLKDRRVVRNVGLIALGIMYIHTCKPVAFGHSLLPSSESELFRRRGNLRHD